MNNPRIIISRNKREGWYIGRTHYDRQTGGGAKIRHARQGLTFGGMPMSLRDWMRYPWRNVQPIPF